MNAKEYIKNELPFLLSSYDVSDEQKKEIENKIKKLKTDQVGSLISKAFSLSCDIEQVFDLAIELDNQ